MTVEMASSSSRMQGGVVECTLVGHTKPVSALSFSPSGHYLATGSADGVVKIWSLVGGDGEPMLVLTLRGHTAGVNDVCWSADSVYVASCSDDRTVKVWNVVTGGTLVRDYKGQHTSYVLCLAFNPQSTLIVSGGFDETVRLWNVSQKPKPTSTNTATPQYTCHRTIAAHSEAVSSVGFNRDGTMIVSASYDGLIRLWDTTTGQCLKTLVHKDQSPIGSVQFTPNSAHLLCTSLDSTIRLWDIYNAKILKSYTSHTNVKYPIKSALFRPGANAPTSSLPQTYVVSGSEDDMNGVYLWDLQTKSVTHTLASPPSSSHAGKHTVLALALHPTLPLLATAALDHTNSVKIWHLTLLEH